VHSLSNLPDAAAALDGVRVPDVCPADLPPGVDFSLVAGACAAHHLTSTEVLMEVAGDFEEVYGAPGNEHAGQWDAVLTCFFIDTVSVAAQLCSRH
jgi:carnosine N-methyltransferase